MKAGAILALILVVCQSMSIVQDPIHDGEDFLEAFYIEAFGIHLALKDCEGDARSLITVLNESLNMIESWDNLIQVRDAALNIVNNRDLIKLTYVECKSCGPAFKSGIDQMRPLTNPATLTSAIKGAELHHPISFNRNLLKFKNAWARGDYEEAGKYAGKDMKYLLDEVDNSVVSEEMVINEFEQFIDAFWFHALDIPLQLEGCTQNTQNSIKVIQKVVYLLTDRSSKIGTLLAIAYVKNHYMDLASAFTMCTKAAPQLISGTKKLWPLHDLGAASTATTKAIKHHPIGFPNNLRKGKNAVSNGEWADAGKYFGIDTHYILDEME